MYVITVRLITFALVNVVEHRGCICSWRKMWAALCRTGVASMVYGFRGEETSRGDAVNVSECRAENHS